MFLIDLFEANEQPPKIAVIYPGRFQPFHKGHKAVYDYLVDQYGFDNVWITTSDKVEPGRSPFNFQEKLAMMQLTGINPSRIVQSAQPYQAKEVTSKYDPDRTMLLVAVSEKDMAEDPRFSFAPKKDGSASYFQPKPKGNKLQWVPMSKHGLITTVPTVDFTVLGKPMRSATDIRAQFSQANEATKKAIIKDLFGAYNNEVYNIMSSNLAEDASGYIPKNKREAKDPRWSNALSVGVTPKTPYKNAKALKLV